MSVSSSSDTSLGTLSLLLSTPCNQPCPGGTADIQNKFRATLCMFRLIICSLRSSPVPYDAPPLHPFHHQRISWVFDCVERLYSSSTAIVSSSASVSSQSRRVKAAHKEDAMYDRVKQRHVTQQKSLAIAEM